MTTTGAIIGKKYVFYEKIYFNCDLRSINQARVTSKLPQSTKACYRPLVHSDIALWDNKLWKKAKFWWFPVVVRVLRILKIVKFDKILPKYLFNLIFQKFSIWYGKCLKIINFVFYRKKVVRAPYNKSYSVSSLCLRIVFD